MNKTNKKTENKTDYPTPTKTTDNCKLKSASCINTLWSNLKNEFFFSAVIINVVGDSATGERFTKKDAKEIRRLLGF